MAKKPLVSNQVIKPNVTEFPFQSQSIRVFSSLVWKKGTGLHFAEVVNTTEINDAN